MDVYVRGNMFDTMLAHYLIEPEASHDLENFMWSVCWIINSRASDNTVNSACERVDLALQVKSKLLS